MKNATRPGSLQGDRRMAGMTLVELLVAMMIGLLIVLAATSALLAARRGFTTVDSASQLRDNARFATVLIQRLAVQAGYRDLSNAATKRSATGASGASPLPYAFGFDNALASRTSLDNGTARPARSYGDVLVLRFQPTESFPGSNTVDTGMIDCGGHPADTPASQRDDAQTSVFFVDASSDGEPTLKCYRSTTGSPPFTPVTLIRGVENFQVLYGVDGVKPNAAINPADPSSTPDTVPDRYLRADQLAVAGDTAATRANWRRVRSLRIGLVLRSDPASTQKSEARTIFPLGSASFASTDDIGSQYEAPADGRLRQVVTFTVHLRNDQGE
jgi:type IV pilus assembly protein PilW